VHSRRLVPEKYGPLQELAKLISGSPPVPKNTFKKASTTTSTAGDSQTEANVPPSCPQLETLAPRNVLTLLDDDIGVCPEIE
jgi:hypothetical protein